MLFYSIHEKRINMIYVKTKFNKGFFWNFYERFKGIVAIFDNLKKKKKISQLAYHNRDFLSF